MAVQPHILTITESTEGGVTEHAYVIDCPGVTDRCRSNLLCEAPDCTAEDAEDDTVVAHGVQHIWVDDANGWYVPTDQCHLAGHDSLPEAAEALKLRPGMYPVDYFFGDGYDLELSVRVEVAA
ncbi:hypothetical protein OG423_14210 [Micromonospora zamorensis]|uniref:hypothetical protein n=1 Tax=Micromonospora zamorensis TaxID=709883 RepID=UPI00352A55E5|nr:hypothetical protein OG423_14210 [Micromonospora zamorensis]